MTPARSQSDVRRLGESGLVRWRDESLVIVAPARSWNGVASGKRVGDAGRPFI